VAGRRGDPLAGRGGALAGGERRSARRRAAALAVLLELPPAEMERILAAGLRAVPEAASPLSRAAVRFHPPQWLRIQDAVERLRPR
jgi:hypothetical protein